MILLASPPAVAVCLRSDRSIRQRAPDGKDVRVDVAEVSARTWDKPATPTVTTPSVGLSNCVRSIVGGLSDYRDPRAERREASLGPSRAASPRAQIKPRLV